MEINNLISKFNERGKLKLEELLKLTGLKESANNVEKRKIEDIEKREDFGYHSNISNLTARFNKTGKLEPEEMLSLLESKKYTVEIKKEVFGVDLVFIEAVEKGYFEGIPPFSKELENLLREEPLTVEDARKSLAEFSLLLNEDKSREEHIKLHLMSLEKRLVTTLR